VKTKLVKDNQEHFINAKNIRSLLDVLTQLDGMKAEITVRVSIEELQRLTPDQCAAFLNGIAEIAIANSQRTAQGQPREPK
jgi:hypothetical protein